MRQRSVLAIFVIFYAVASQAWAGGSAEQGQTRQLKGTLEYMEGEVTVNGTTAELGMTVPEGAWVQTGSAGHCDIVFGGKNVIRLFPDSRMQLDLPARRARLESGGLGAVFHRLQTLISNGDTFQLTSPSVTAGVRGTVFYARSSSPEETYFCTCHGKIDLQDPEQENQQRLVSARHGAYWYRSSESGYRTQKAELLYHDEKTMDAIAQRIDEQIPWGQQP